MNKRAIKLLAVAADHADDIGLTAVSKMIDTAINNARIDDFEIVLAAAKLERIPEMRVFARQLKAQTLEQNILQIVEKILSEQPYNEFILDPQNPTNGTISGPDFIEGLGEEFPMVVQFIQMAKSANIPGATNFEQLIREKARCENPNAKVSQGYANKFLALLNQARALATEEHGLLIDEFQQQQQVQQQQQQAVQKQQDAKTPYYDLAKDGPAGADGRQQVGGGYTATQMKADFSAAINEALNSFPKGDAGGLNKAVRGRIQQLLRSLNTAPVVAFSPEQLYNERHNSLQGLFTNLFQGLNARDQASMQRFKDVVTQKMEEKWNQEFEEVPASQSSPQNTQQAPGKSPPPQPPPAQQQRPPPPPPPSNELDDDEPRQQPSFSISPQQDMALLPKLEFFFIGADGKIYKNKNRSSLSSLLSLQKKNPELAKYFQQKQDASALLCLRFAYDKESGSVYIQDQGVSGEDKAIDIIEKSGKFQASQFIPHDPLKSMRQPPSPPPPMNPDDSGL